MKYTIDQSSFPPPLKTTLWFHFSYGLFALRALQCAGVVLAGSVVIFFFNGFQWILNSQWLLGLSIFFGGIVVYGEMDEKHRKWDKQTELSTIKHNEELEQDLNRNISMAESISNNCIATIKEVDALLFRAESRFGSNLYGPFWDDIESATLKLGEFHDELKALEGLKSEYSANFRSLDGLRHNFPTNLKGRVVVPSPTVSLNRLKKLVESGQSSFHFAMIWESRQTRKVLVAGFETLQESIEGIGRQIGVLIRSIETSPA